MEITIVNVAFNGSAGIKVDYVDGKIAKNHVIPAQALLRKALDAILIDKIREALALPS